MSERQFNVGDRVRIIRVYRIDMLSHLVGSVATLIAYDPSDNTYELDIPSPAGGWWQNVWAEPRNIVPYYDGNEKASWSSCVWQPTKATA